MSASCLFARIDLGFDVDTIDAVMIDLAAVIILPGHRIDQVTHPYCLEDSNMSMGITGAAIAKGRVLTVNIAINGIGRFGE